MLECIKHWDFPEKNDGDGRIGNLCVSRSHKQNVNGVNKQLAVHVTFAIAQIFVPSENGAKGKKEAIKVQVENLHFTARPKDTQLQINDNNCTAYLPDNRDAATHRGIANDWLHLKDDKKLASLAVALELNPTDAQTKPQIQLALGAYNGATLKLIQNAIEAALKVEINNNLAPSGYRGSVPINVTFS